MSGTAAPASEPLRRFLQVARGAGLRVSAAEGIDAARAVRMIGYADREILKDSLGLILAKTPEEKASYDEAFELYFKRDDLAASEDQAQQGQAPAAWAQGGEGGQSEGSGQGLGQLLEQDDRASLATQMEKAARESGIENIRFFTQKNLYARRILDRMGLRQVERDMEALRQSGTPEGLGRAQFLEGRVDQLRDSVRDFVERNLLQYTQLLGYLIACLLDWLLVAAKNLADLERAGRRFAIARGQVGPRRLDAPPAGCGTTCRDHCGTFKVSRCCEAEGGERPARFQSYDQ